MVSIVFRQLLAATWKQSRHQKSNIWRSSQLKTLLHRNKRTIFPEFAPALCQNDPWMPNDIESSKRNVQGGKQRRSESHALRLASSSWEMHTGPPFALYHRKSQTRGGHLWCCWASFIMVNIMYSPVRTPLVPNKRPPETHKKAHVADKWEWPNILNHFL